MYNIYTLILGSAREISTVYNQIFRLGVEIRGKSMQFVVNQEKMITPATKALSAMSNEHVINNCILENWLCGVCYSSFPYWREQNMTSEIQIGRTAPIARGHDISSWSCEVQNSICDLVEQVSKLKQQARSKAM